MRIIAGEFKGRRIQAPRTRAVRPTTDRVKKTIFDVLATRIDFEGIRVLDLFAGSGTLGLEALSRGASHVTFVDASVESLRIIEANLKALHAESRGTLLHANAELVISQLKEPFDLVFVDPPYAYNALEALPIKLASIVAAGGWMIMKHPSKVQLLSSSTYCGTIPGFRFIITKHFGETSVTFFHLEQNTE
ncbi:MAG: 16S rRNA (guanine(966)-N(2))-methyltransferase RsmD [Bacteroidota bacterium]